MIKNDIEDILSRIDSHFASIQKILIELKEPSLDKKIEDCIILNHLIDSEISQIKNKNNKQK